MSDAYRREMQSLLLRMMARGVTQSGIALASGVRQPLVSLAVKGKLVAKTENVQKLFEYLQRAASDLRRAPEPMSAGRDPEARLLKVLSRLSDGSDVGNARLVSLLEAIAALRLGDDAIEF